jgi:hypothetical protein
MTTIESARNLLRSKERKPYLRSSNHLRKNYSNMQKPNFRFNKILIMNAHVLNNLTQWIQKDAVSAGGKLIVGSPYNN